FDKRLLAGQHPRPCDVNLQSLHPPVDVIPLSADLLEVILPTPPRPISRCRLQLRLRLSAALYV
ncbi:hypothetical protein JMJ77_0006185, partial [Colletotrichum scovillei]